LIQLHFGVKLNPPNKSEELFNDQGGFPMSGFMIEKLSYAINTDAIDDGSLTWIENQDEALRVLSDIKTIDIIKPKIIGEIEQLIKTVSKLKYFYIMNGQDELLLINLGSSNEIIVIESIF
jgi:hypothetical protein